MGQYVAIDLHKRRSLIVRADENEPISRGRDTTDAELYERVPSSRADRSAPR